MDTAAEGPSEVGPSEADSEPRTDPGAPLLRAALDACGRALVVGGLSWWAGGLLGALLGVVVVPLTFLEHWGRRQRLSVHTVTLLVLGSWVFACGGSLWAMFQAIYLQALSELGSPAAAYEEVRLAYLALSDPELGAGIWRRLWTWNRLWEWTCSGAAPIATACSWATIFSVSTALGATLPATRAAAAQILFALPLLFLLALVALPPSVPPLHSVTSAQGLEESVMWLGAGLGLALALVCAQWPLGWLVSRTQRLRRLEATLSTPALCVRLAPLLALLALLHVGFVSVPARLAESPRDRALRNLATGGSTARLEAAHVLGRHYGPDREILAALSAALADEDPRVRATAAHSLSTIGLKGEALPALRGALGDPDPKVSKAAHDALWNLARLGYE